MMDHIEEWFFTQLAGIRNTGMAFDTFTIAPYLPADLDHCDITTHTTYGPVRSSWQRTDGNLTYQFSVPSGTTASIVVPCPKGQCLIEGENALTANTGGIHSVTYADAVATVVCGSGQYTWTTGPDPTPTHIGEVQGTKNKVQNEVAVFDLAGRRLAATSNRLPEGEILIVGQQKVLRRE